MGASVELCLCRPISLPEKAKEGREFERDADADADAACSVQRVRQTCVSSSLFCRSGRPAARFCCVAEEGVRYVRVKVKVEVLARLRGRRGTE